MGRDDDAQGRSKKSGCARRVLRGYLRCEGNASWRKIARFAINCGRRLGLASESIAVAVLTLGLVALPPNYPAISTPLWYPSRPHQRCSLRPAESPQDQAWRMAPSVGTVLHRISGTGNAMPTRKPRTKWERSKRPCLSPSGLWEGPRQRSVARAVDAAPWPPGHETEELAPSESWGRGVGGPQLCRDHPCKHR